MQKFPHLSRWVTHTNFLSEFNIVNLLCNCVIFTKNQYQLVALYHLFVGSLTYFDLTSYAIVRGTNVMCARFVSN